MEGDCRLGHASALRAEWDTEFGSPRKVLRAHRLDEIAPVLARVDAAARSGSHAVVVLAYEAGPAFDPALSAHDPAPFPLAWAALYDSPASSSPTPPTSPTQGPDAWRPLVSREDYDRAVADIRELIAAGETYQVNLTMPFEARFSDDARAWYEWTAPGLRGGLSAFVDMGRFAVASFSPELFFRVQGRDIVARPMKGTAPRGRWPAEDARYERELAASPKERAENVMIVDLLRNDLGKVAEPGGVRAEPLFEVEPYPTVFQMTSTVSARLRPGLGWADALGALFPCGSITGAPKIATSRIIRRLEPHPRRVYCGAIGHVAPGGDAVFSVPIRTALIDREAGSARFFVGGGITWDSTAPGEYVECQSKLRFLLQPPEPFDLLESLLLHDGTWFLAERHLSRMAGSARILGFDLDLPTLRALLDAAAREHPAGRFRVRLTADRHGAARAEAIPIPAPDGRAWTVGLAPEPVDSADHLLFHKTTRRGLYERARAARPDCDEVLLTNERGELTEGTITNLAAELDGRLVTPARDCGLLAGCFRDHLLDKGVLREAVLRPDDLRRATRVWLINSVRRWIRVRLPLRF